MLTSLHHAHHAQVSAFFYAIGRGKRERKRKKRKKKRKKKGKKKERKREKLYSKTPQLSVPAPEAAPVK
jgi:hypothetical protein